VEEVEVVHFLVVPVEVEVDMVPEEAVEDQVSVGQQT
jgi:hypothetical protein